MLSKLLVKCVLGIGIVGIGVVLWRRKLNLIKHIHEDEDLPELTPQTFGLPLSAHCKVMVCLSGWPDNHDVWKYQIDAFQDGYHIVSITSPDHDQSRLRRPWGYTLHEAPTMIRKCLDKYLGHDRYIDVFVIHDWGALWGYYILQEWRDEQEGEGEGEGERRMKKVGRVVAVDIGSSPHDDPLLPSDVPGITQWTLFSLPYQWIMAFTFILGSGVNETITAFFVKHIWITVPLLSPMHISFNWHKDAPRPQHEVEWWLGYTYYYLWKARFGFGPSVPSPLFPRNVHFLYMYGKKKRTMFHSDEFLARLKDTNGCRVVEYVDAGHWLMFTHAKQFNNDVLSFIS